MNIQDLAILLAAVELAVKRGAFSVFEVGAVSEAAGKLNNFLADAKRQQDEAAAEQTEGGDKPAETAQPEQPEQSAQ